MMESISAYVTLANIGCINDNTDVDIIMICGLFKFVEEKYGNL